MEICPVCNMTANDRIKFKFIALLKCYQDMLDIFNSSMTWEKKFDTIFEMRVMFDKILEHHGTSLNDWYDPDTTYEEDVTAYMDAVKSTMRDLALID